jgi:hypothetical protein
MIQSFFLAMTLHTSAQQKAQAELDAVVGTDRLPTPADRARLPYLEALLCEVIRTYVYGIRAYYLLPHSAHIVPPFNIQHLAHVISCLYVEANAHCTCHSTSAYGPRR